MSTELEAIIKSAITQEEMSHVFYQRLAGLVSHPETKGRSMLWYRPLRRYSGHRGRFRAGTGDVLYPSDGGQPRRMGFEGVFDTDFGADLTIVEESNEFLQRLADMARCRC